MARHFFVEKNKIKKGRAFISGDEARHIGTVLRRTAGDAIHLVDEDGCEYCAVIVACSAKRIEVALLEKHPPPEPSHRHIILGQALTKFQTMDYIVQKATELGVSAIIPFLASRSVLRLSNEQLRLKCLRWQKIARESTKQCGRRAVPPVEQILSFSDMVRSSGDNLLKIILWEDEKNTGLREVIHGSDMHHSMVVVGPEGGFTNQEVALARHGGFRSVSLAGHILRTETAALYVLSVLHYEWETFA
jgi:16S rRNA (uracil1498-N3)-methyltransferase